MALAIRSADFQHRATLVADDITLLAGKVRQNLDRIAAPFLDGEGTIALPHMVPFALALRDQRTAYQPIIKSIANKISGLAGENWVGRKEVIRLWHQLAEDVVGNFGEHPVRRKNVGAIIVSSDNRMLAWDVNRIPAGIEKVPEAYQSGQRTNIITCAEPNVQAQIFGARAEQLKREPDRPINDYLDRAKAVVADYKAEIQEHKGAMRGLYMIVETNPCKSCAESVASSNAHGVIARAEPRGGKFTRQSESADSLRILEAAHVAVLHVSDAALIPQRWPQPIL